MARKITNGDIRNKERTKLKLISAVGEILRTEGYTKLGVNNIAKKAEVSKKLIYRYFDTVDNLIETYVRNKDYWMSIITIDKELVEQHKGNNGKDLPFYTLENLFHHLMANPETQKILLWGISEKSDLMSEINNQREELGSKLFAVIDPSFDKTDLDIRAVCALLLGGIYYLTLHANSLGGTVCEIDIKTEEGKNRIIKSLRNILIWTYEEGDIQKVEH
jgi:AcrR family transcriptional regulator